MNSRQRAFAEHYSANPNATEAAKAAGYSAKTAYSIGQRMLKNVEVQAYIRRLQNEAAQIRIASIVEVKAIWSDILRDPTQKTGDRLKAGELIARAAGAFVHFTLENSSFSTFPGENDGEDVIIYVPQLESIEDHEVEEDEPEESIWQNATDSR
jgi:phage terminase small subunit